MKKKAKTGQKSPEVVVEVVAPTPTDDKRILRCLIDSGSTESIILDEFLGGLKKSRNAKTQQWQTKGGVFSTSARCCVPFFLVDFATNKRVMWTFHVDNSTTSKQAGYDMIIGRDLLIKLGIDIKFSSGTLKWEDTEIPMRESGELRDRQIAYHCFYASDDVTATKQLTKRAVQILDSKYDAIDVGKVVAEQVGLDKSQKAALHALLTKYKNLFNGELGDWDSSPVSIELQPNAKPFHARAYPVPQIHEAAMKREVERLVLIGVLEESNDSEWGAPTFIIPKKDGRIRFISDFRKLNTFLKRKPFPIPKIQDMLLKLKGFTYASALDLNMGYYTIRLDPDAQKLCTIVLPWGKYKYKRLPMGLAGSPDIFQEKMSDLMRGLEFVRCYLDDVLIISTSTFEEHLTKVEQCFQRIAKAGLKINPDKSFFGKKEIEYLGYWVTQHGIQPQVKKVNSILTMEEPKNRKQLRGFIGLINYYRDMWRRRSHVLAPLTVLTSKKVPWKWGEAEQKAFKEAKRIISKNAMLAFPDFNKKFVIYTDASKYQLGGVITQDNKPLAFYSRKLKDAQTRYTTTERELLSIVETLKEFRNILLGHEIEVFTDHKNLIYDDLKTERVLRWRLLMEEYGVKITYIKGVENIVADVLSRYPTQNDPELEVPAPTPDTMADLFATANDLPADAFPLSFKILSTMQQQDPLTEEMLNKNNETSKHLSRKTFHGGEQLVCYDEKIYVPPALRNNVVTWYHEYLCHPGETRTEETIRQHLWWPGLRTDVRRHVDRCPACQRGKKKRLKYGHLPPKEAEYKPWEHLCVDTIGPYRIRRKGKKELVFQAVTFMDPATGWFELKQTKTKQADEVANLVEQTWLSRYPWPEFITFDNGPEFKAEFGDLLRKEYPNIKIKPSSKRNPQANAILERAHGTIGNMIRTYQVEDIDLDEDDPFAGLVSAVGFAVRSTYHTTLQSTPGQLVFGRDMIFPIQHIADWQLIKNRKQKLIDKNNERENAKRVDYDYKIGDQVLIYTPDPNKMEQPREGPYPVMQVHTNGTVTLQKGAVTQRYNIRQIVPFQE
jgi:hypothetical protein